MLPSTTHHRRGAFQGMTYEQLMIFRTAQNVLLAGESVRQMAEAMAEIQEEEVEAAKAELPEILKSLES